MKPVGMTLLIVCVSSLVVGGVVLAAPDVSPVWSVGALALLAGALLASHCRPRCEPAPPRRERVIFEKRIRVGANGLPEEPRRAGGQHEILLRIVDARGSQLRAEKLDWHGQSINSRRSRTI